MTDKTLNHITENTDSIEAAFDVFHSIDTLKQRLISKLVSELTMYANEKDYIIKTDELTGKNKHQGIQFLLSNQKNLPFEMVFEFDGTAFNCPSIGLRATSKEVKNGDTFVKATQLFKEHYGQKRTESNDNWCGWYKFQPYNWWSSSKPWQMIQTGEMATLIIKEIDELYTFFKSEIIKLG